MSELDRAFEALPEIEDDGFSDAVIARVRTLERRMRIARRLTMLALGLATVVLAIVGGALLRALGPYALAGLGLGATAGAWILRPARSW